MEGFERIVARRRHKEDGMAIAVGEEFSTESRRIDGVPAPKGWRLLGQSPAIGRLRESIERVAPLRAAVLISGESGTGKELVATEIHARSGRAGAFVAINCAAVPESLFASELFGHEKGSFTGATRRHQGHFERSHGGTIFLDEVTEMPLPLQATMLRILETGSFVRVGGETEVPFDLRVIASTNRDPQEAVREGAFRADLYYRLSEFFISVPPLRRREDDVVLLAECFLAELNERYSTRRRFAPGELRKLRDYSWPGNVRELRHAIQRHYVLSEGADGLLVVTPSGADAPAELMLRPGMSIAQMERRLIDLTLDHYRGDKRLTAAALGISLRTLYNRLKEYRYEAPELESAGASHD
jgi:two-component system, NtrC family, response regulator AtoC